MLTNVIGGITSSNAILLRASMVVAWGDNTYGQLNVPSGLSNAVAVAGGGCFSLALRNDGTIIGWGDNTYGETNIPVGLSNVVAIAAGLYHGVAVLADGSVTNWGEYLGWRIQFLLRDQSVPTPARHRLPALWRWRQVRRRT